MQIYNQDELQHRPSTTTAIIGLITEQNGSSYYNVQVTNPRSHLPVLLTGVRGPINAGINRQAYVTRIGRSLWEIIVLLPVSSITDPVNAWY